MSFYTFAKSCPVCDMPPSAPAEEQACMALVIGCVCEGQIDKVPLCQRHKSMFIGFAEMIIVRTPE